MGTNASRHRRQKDVMGFQFEDDVFEGAEMPLLAPIDEVCWSTLGSVCRTSSTRRTPHSTTNGRCQGCGRAGKQLRESNAAELGEKINANGRTGKQSPLQMSTSMPNIRTRLRMLCWRYRAVTMVGNYMKNPAVRAKKMTSRSAIHCRPRNLTSREIILGPKITHPTLTKYI